MTKPRAGFGQVSIAFAPNLCRETGKEIRWRHAAFAQSDDSNIAPNISIARYAEKPADSSL